ncbi:MAG: glycosyltransferase family 61 protein, partial [Chitinophagaceae bacterium]|nr:glycosyltransferase family 61 protein [Chitinophagaceae bacterium]
YAYPAYIFQTLSKLAEKNISKNNLDEQLPENFIISRRKVGSRNLVNEDLLLNHFPTLNLKIVFLELLPFHQQVALFNNAKLIIAPHGAGLTNLTYCKPDVIVYEIYPIGRSFNQTSSFYQISKSINIKYHLMMTPPINKNEEMMIDEELLEKITELNKKYLLI